jgi:uncharacterized protein YndB with AHSA1/START domain
MENNKELTIVRVFDAPKELVFRAWTDPKLASQWWGPNGVTNPVCEIDAKAGGIIDIVMLAGEELGKLKGSRWPMKGVFQEVTPSEKIVFTASPIMDNKPVMETITTVKFEEDGNKTKMTLHILVTKVTPEAEGPLSGMEMGWNQSIEKLSKFVEKLDK